MMYNKHHNHIRLFFRFHQKAAFFSKMKAVNAVLKFYKISENYSILKIFFKPLFINELYIEKVIFLKKKNQKTHLECCWNKKGYHFIHHIS